MAGRYQAGSELLAQLFAETGNPNYVFNQGRCFEQNGKPDEAVLRFREYSRIAKNLTAEQKLEVEQHIADCQAAKVRDAAAAIGAAQGPSPVTPPPAEPTQQTPSPDATETLPPASAQAATGTTVQAEAPSAPAQAPVESLPTSPGTDKPRVSANSRLRVPGIVTAAVGAAAVVAGVVASLKTKSVRDEVTDDNARHTFDRDKYDRGLLYSRLQWVGYGVGSAAIIGGAVLYYMSDRGQTPKNDSISLLPTVSASQAGFVLQGSY